MRIRYRPEIVTPGYRKDTDNVNSADVKLIEQIQQVTRGGSRLLVTLARRGKGLERDDPQRAAFLLASVGRHPLYKGGRLAFDMLEIEDLMLDGSSVDLMGRREVMQVLTSGAHRFAETLRQMSSPVEGGLLSGESFARDAEMLDDSVLVPFHRADEAVEAPIMPRVSLGPSDDVPRTENASAGRVEGRDTKDNEPELQSSDYLYDYVVLGLLDAVSGMKLFQS